MKRKKKTSANSSRKKPGGKNQGAEIKAQKNEKKKKKKENVNWRKEEWKKKAGLKITRERKGLSAMVGGKMGVLQNKDLPREREEGKKEAPGIQD